MTRKPRPVPLHVGIVGNDSVLALGARYPSSLTVAITNISVVDSITFRAAGPQPTRLVLGADVQPPGERRPWALGTASEVAALTAQLAGATWRSAVNQQGLSPQWIFTTSADVVLRPGETLELRLDGVISSLPPGRAHLSLRCEGAPGFIDAQFAFGVDKTDQCIATLPLCGGGQVSWQGPGGRLRWTAAFVALGQANPTAYGRGDVEIHMPPQDLPPEHVHDGAARSAADGIVLNAGEALYAVHDTGPDAPFLSFRIVDRSKAFKTAGNWRLIAAVHPLNLTVTLGTGLTLNAGSASTAGSAIPVGMVIMWSGTIDRIPRGWALCDGSNGTPDLRDRFVVGAGNNYTVGATGGADTVALSAAQMPVHSHSASSGATGDHFHWTEGINADGLSMRTRFNWGDTTVDMGHGGGWAGDPNDQRWRGRVNTDNQGTHAHNIDVALSGGGETHENRPPYLALAFIMKT